MQTEKYTILVVDDDERSRELLARHLETQGYLVSVAENGVRATEMVEIEDYNLILLDIMMPGVDGLEVLTALKSQTRTQSVPVVMLSAVSDKETVTKAVKLGAIDYLVKPYDFRTARMRIWRILQTTKRGSKRNALAQDSVENAGQGSVLVVDDEELNRDILSRRVQRLGHIVELAENGQQAVQLLQSNDFDLILLDVMMPVMDGIKVLEHVKSHARLSHISVVMITADDSTESYDACLALGADEYITKPFHSSLLKSRINSCISLTRDRRIEQARDRYLEELEELGTSIAEQKQSEA